MRCGKDDLSKYGVIFVNSILLYVQWESGKYPSRSPGHNK